MVIEKNDHFYSDCVDAASKYIAASVGSAT